MKKLLIGLLALGSMSLFASDFECKAAQIMNGESTALAQTPLYYGLYSINLNVDWTDMSELLMDGCPVAIYTFTTRPRHTRLNDYESSRIIVNLMPEVSKKSQGCVYSVSELKRHNWFDKNSTKKVDAIICK